MIDHDYAQTNLQLYRQVRAAGYDDVTLGRVRTAYDLAAEISAGLLRPSGKPFVAHVVGTASIAAASRADPSVVIAGLLHSACRYGDFGAGRGSPTGDRSARIATAAGPQAAGLVEAWDSLPWTARSIEGLLAGERPAEGSITEHLAMLRLANEIEDLLDGALAYRGPNAPTHPHAWERRHLACDLARAWGMSSLADVLAPLVAEAEHSEPAPEAMQHSHRTSYPSGPASPGLGLATRLRHGAAKLRRRWSPSSPAASTAAPHTGGRA